MNKIMKTLSQTKAQRLIAIIAVALAVAYPLVFPQSIYIHLLICTLGIYIIVNTGF